ncbi:hypothetical protein [Okeania sp. SIO2C9]|uniref:hypothetical protein n=1 Tax=Okeania sp. SIO2C9 TaxID=2607791 RepID=UPI0025E6465B|nr:hypothetical protein [Okeania sp. SIO2C9]
MVVDRFFPSSKTCSRCGHVQDMPLFYDLYQIRLIRYTKMFHLQPLPNISLI